MIIPIRCVTCGKVLANKWEYYKKKVEELKKKEEKEENKDKYFTFFQKEILDELDLEKYCCRRIMISTVETIDDL